MLGRKETEQTIFNFYHIILSGWVKTPNDDFLDDHPCTTLNQAHLPMEYFHIPPQEMPAMVYS